MSTLVLPDVTERLRRAVDLAAMRALGDQDRDPSSPTYGCFDRRYWAWKLVDFPEATFQRHVYPLALLLRDPASRLHDRADVFEAVEAGLRFAVRIQHRNGSFDQAFPFEQSWGATAFLLQPLVAAFECIRAAGGRDLDRIALRLSASAAFLRTTQERHGRITNHLAGGAHALLAAGAALADPPAAAAGAALVAEILASQSPEGWFPEYDGADPGYQTLCVHYLAEIAALNRTADLMRGLERAVDFLQWFVHPDGTLGGLYGSRRTRVAYPGGLAILSKEFPAAAAMTRALMAAAADDRSVSVQTVDAGNLAPLLTSVVRALSVDPAPSGYALPCDRPSAAADFPDAGLHVRSTASAYAVVGARNGGTLTVFDRASKQCLRDDGGYVADLSDGRRITSQVTGPHRVTAEAGAISVDATFAAMPRPVPTPARFLALRLLNLTLMRSLSIGNAIKRMLVAVLIAPQAPVPLSVQRRVVFGTRITVTDRFDNAAGLTVTSIRGGFPFVSVHMASAGYYDGAMLASAHFAPVELDAEALTRNRSLEAAAEL